MIQKDAYLVTSVAENGIGIELSATALSICIDDASRVAEGQMFLADGDSVRVERLQSNSAFGTADRVKEESVRSVKLFARDSELFRRLNTPFWLLPVSNIESTKISMIVKTNDFSLFGTADFQISCWSRLVWGTAFFNDPSTPQEHSKLAWTTKLTEGLLVPVFVRGSIPGVMKLDSDRGNGEFESSLFLLGGNDVHESDEIFSKAQMICEGIEASFERKIGVVRSVVRGRKQKGQA